MPIPKTLRLAAALLAIALLWLAVHRLPVLRWVVLGARFAHGLGPAGALLAVLAIYLLTLLFLPIVPLTIAAGWLYGPWGAAISLAAAVASAATAFSVARALGHGAAAQALRERPRARALAELAADGGVLTVVLIRVSPILPYTPSNALLGLTGLRLRALVLGTALGMAPGTALFVWAGSLLPSAEALEAGEHLHAGFALSLLGLGFCAAAVMAAAARRRLRSLRPK